MLSIKIDKEFDEIDLKDPIQKSLVQSAPLVQGQARRNAPVLRWTLRRSIQTDLRQVRDWIAVVYSDLAYARKREFENRKNPRRKFYMKNAASEKAGQVEKIFLNNLKDV